MPPPKESIIIQSVEMSTGFSYYIGNRHFVCHPELVSGSQMMPCQEILKQY